MANQNIEYRLLFRRGDGLSIITRGAILRQLSDSELISRYNDAVRKGHITHADSLLLAAMRMEFKNRFNRSPIDLIDDVIRLNGLIKAEDFLANPTQKGKL